MYERWTYITDTGSINISLWDCYVKEGFGTIEGLDHNTTLLVAAGMLETANMMKDPDENKREGE